MSTEPAPRAPLSAEKLEQLFAEADTGGRKPAGWARRALFLIAVAWSVFQLWYASPLPFASATSSARRETQSPGQ